MPLPRWLPRSLILVGSILLLPAALHAQAAPPHATQYWLSAGAGIGVIGTSGTWKGATGTATSLGLTVQRHAFVTSVRWVRASDTPLAAWHLAAMAGLGTSPRFPLRGSLAAGLGVAGRSDDGAHLTLPLELQLGWRVAPGIGVGVVGFAHLGGPTTTLGAAFGLQLGRLR